MKNKLFWLILILTGCAILFSIIKGPSEEVGDFKPLEINVGDVFDYLDYPNMMYVLNYMIKDVTGDGTTDMIMVIGEKKSVDDLMASNMDLVLYEPNGDRFFRLKMKNMNGQMPKISAHELTGDGVQDIVLIAKQDDETSCVRVASFQNEEWKEIMKAKDNRGIIFQGSFNDGFRGNIKNAKYQKDIALDLQNRKENYVSNGFYDESGRLLNKDAKISSSNFVIVDFVQLEGYEGIQTTQYIYGFNNEDVLDEITVIWKFENGKWMAKEAVGNVIGNLLY